MSSYCLLSAKKAHCLKFNRTGALVTAMGQAYKLSEN